jgi:WXG100 family type VII secretion target
MSDIIKMNYEQMEDMSRTFNQSAQTMEDTIKEMQSIIQMLEGGTLLGKGGDAFVNAMQGQLIPAVNRLKEKFEELSGDIMGAMTALRDGDTQSESRFKG